MCLLTIPCAVAVFNFVHLPPFQTVKRGKPAEFEWQAECKKPGGDGFESLQRSAMDIQSPLMKPLDRWNFPPGLLCIGNRKASSCGTNENA